jgi:hypothetical protein
LRKQKYWLIPILILVIFLLEYSLIINYIDQHFQYNDVLKKELLEDEKINFYFSVIEKLVFMVLQFIATILCINIGLLFFNYKVKVKKIVKVVLQSFMAIVIVQFLIIAYMQISGYVFSTSVIESVENQLYITNYLDTKNMVTYLILPLQTLNVTHLLYMLLLTYGLRTIIKKSFIQSLFFTFKTYGIVISIWFVFTMIMEMNFN